jgi:putative two-component system response regulator
MNYSLHLKEKATILVVDDTPDNLALMSGLLKEKYYVKVASGGEKAIKIAQSDNPPDLILLDIMMPEMDGYEVCRRLQQDPKTRNIPVIFLTAKSQPEDEAMGIGLGAVDYIIKLIAPPFFDPCPRSCRNIFPLRYTRLFSKVRRMSKFRQNARS